MNPALLLTSLTLLVASAHAVEPSSPLMLAGPWVPDDSHRLDFDKLPRVPSQHAVVSDVRASGSSPAALNKKKGGVNQHNYLAHHDGQFWAMWSDGPGIEDRVGQRVKFATSSDGLKWSHTAVSHAGAAELGAKFAALRHTHGQGFPLHLPRLLETRRRVARAGVVR